ncbi:MAG: hypothetical protein NC131_04120 [Roseburia sp.]|nr:hypothetical protein [Roseburia sp.]
MDKLFSKKIRVVILVTIFSINALLIIVSIFYGLPISEEYNYMVKLMYSLLSAFTVANFAFYIAYFASKKYEWDTFFSALLIVFTALTFVGSAVCGALSCVFFDGARRWFLLAAGVSQAVLYWLVIFVPLVILKIVKGIFALFKHIFKYFNIGYTGKPVMSFGRKIGEVILQIILLPVSAVLQVMATPYCVMCMHYLGALIIQHLFYIAMKKEEPGVGSSYYVSESDNIVTETVTHNIKDENGVVIGSYDTQESHIEHDSGYRYENPDDVKQFRRAVPHSFIVLPCRIISLFFSVLALFIPHLYVSSVKPKGEIEIANWREYEFLDIIILRKKENEIIEPTKSID